MTFAVVKWLDASFERCEQRPEQVNRRVELVSCGFLLHDDAEGVTVASDHDPVAGTYRFALSIPRANVLRVEKVEAPCVTE